MSKDNNVFVLGHRGCVALPENTLPAFEHALKHADGIEFDVWKAKDGELVIIHDDTVGRTTDGKGYVSNLTLAELRALKIKNADGQIVDNVIIPTLQEALDLVAEYQSQGQEKWVNIELKGPDVATDVVAMVQECVSEERLNASNIIISSFDHKALAEVKQLDSTLQRGLLFEQEDEVNLAQLVSDLDPYSIHANVEDLLKGKTNPFGYDCPVGSWARGENRFKPEIIRQAAQGGVELIITNFPKEAKESLEQEKW